jgi:hypothetical protein
MKQIQTQPKGRRKPMIYIRGEVTGKRTGQYEGKPYAALQFLDRLEDGSVRFIEVNLPDGADHTVYRVGQSVDLRVLVSARDKKIYYRAVGTASAPAARTSTKS